MAVNDMTPDTVQAGLDDAEPVDIFPRLKGWVKASLTEHADWYKEAKECFGFVAGRSVKGDGQWPGTSWQEMIDSGRQPVEFNRCGPIIDSICGMEVNNRQEVKYLPRTEGDTAIDERLTSLADWARDETHAEDEESEMFRDAVICGRGFTETRIDFDEEPMGKIIVDHLDPLLCGVDTARPKANFANSRYRWYLKDIDTDEAAGMFPGIHSSTLNASWADAIDLTDGGEGNKRDYPDETRPGMDSGKPPKTVRIVQIQWWERETMHMVAGPDDQEPQMMSANAWDMHPGNPDNPNASEEAAEGGYTAQKVEQRRYYQAFLGRNSIIGEKIEIECFTINACTGRLDRNKGFHYGVVRPMRDPQMLANKTLSQVLHILNTNAKGGLIIEKGVFANPRDAEKDWSDPSKTIVVNSGGMEKIKDRTAPNMPPALVQLQEFSVSSIRDVTGVSVEMLGLADREQAASLEYQRRQSAMTILASLFDSLRRYRKLSGRTMLEQLKKLPPGILVRVLIDPKQAEAAYQQQMQQWQMAAEQAQAQGQQPPEQPKPVEEQFKDPRGEKFDPAAFGLSDDAKFDVIVDEAPSSPNQKEGTWAALSPFIAQLPPQAMPIVLRASPLPESMAKELGDAITAASEGSQVPPELQKQIDQGQQRMQQLEQENQQLKGDRAVDQQKLVIEGENARTKRMQVLGAAEQGANEQQAQSELAELREQFAVLAQSQHAIMQMLTGGQQGG